MKSLLFCLIACLIAIAVCEETLTRAKRQLIGYPGFGGEYPSLGYGFGEGFGRPHDGLGYGLRGYGRERYPYGRGFERYPYGGLGYGSEEYGLGRYPYRGGFEEYPYGK